MKTRANYTEWLTNLITKVDEAFNKSCHQM